MKTLLLYFALTTTPSLPPARPPLTPCKTCFVVQQPVRHPTPPRPRNGRGHSH